MTRAEFIGGLALELWRREEPCAPAELRAFAHEVWPLVVRDPRPAAWADAYIRRVHADIAHDRIAA
jgi:hypothetical protein